MERPIRIAAHLQLQHADYDAIRCAALDAENIGVDIVFNYDHFFPLSGDPNGKVFECWTVLGVWAESTTYAPTPDELRELGFTLFTWTVGGPTYDIEPLREWIGWRDKTQRLRLAPALREMSHEIHPGHRTGQLAVGPGRSGPPERRGVCVQHRRPRPSG